MSVDTTDILLKAAEDVQPGLWCKGVMFQYEDEIGGLTLWPGEFEVDDVIHLKRCAVGSVALATALLGGDKVDYMAACERAGNWVELPEGAVEVDFASPEGPLIYFNDCMLPEDAVDAGHQLSELFRKAAESL